MSNNKIVYLVHCLDTEGPLWEDLEGTFECIERSTGLSFPATDEQIARLRQGLDVPPGYEETIKEFVSEKRLNYKRTWTEVDDMMAEIMTPEWRLKMADDAGAPYVISWFIIDHVGFEINPRRRDMGFHQIYNRYKNWLDRAKPAGDALYWHFHPVSYSREAHKTSFSFGYTNHHLQVISRRVIDHLDFPAAYRPGCHCERPDINFFLEQWVPFDFGNQGMVETEAGILQKDVAGGRYGDWRRATDQWEPYHPDFRDYQKKGAMKRWIARTLNLGSRVRNVDQVEVKKAFARADSGQPTILSVTNHDFREIRTDIAEYMDLVRTVGKRFPEVRTSHANAVDALRLAEGLTPEKPAQLTFSWDDCRLEVRADKPLWGQQPWFCFKTKTGEYIHENLDFQEGNCWSFWFDEETIKLDQLEAIGLATNDDYGNSSVYVISPDQDPAKIRFAFRNPAPEGRD